MVIVWVVLLGVIWPLLLIPCERRGEEEWEKRDEMPLELRREMEFKLRTLEWLEKRAAEIEEFSPTDERRGDTEKKE